MSRMGRHIWMAMRELGMGTQLVIQQCNLGPGTILAPVHSIGNL